jgi:hypothetical protein
MFVKLGQAGRVEHLQRKTTYVKWHFNALDGHHRYTLWSSVGSLFFTFCPNK